MALGHILCINGALGPIGPQGIWGNRESESQHVLVSWTNEP